MAACLGDGLLREFLREVPVARVQAQRPDEPRPLRLAELDEIGRRHVMSLARGSSYHEDVRAARSVSKDLRDQGRSHAETCFSLLLVKGERSQSAHRARSRIPAI